MAEQFSGAGVEIELKYVHQLQDQQKIISTLLRTTWEAAHRKTMVYL